MGTKKKSIAQMERQQLLREKKEKGLHRKVVKPVEKKVGGVSGLSLDERFLKDLSKMKVITPYILASQYDIRLSLAKDILEQLEKMSLIRLVLKSSRISIYEPIVGD